MASARWQVLALLAVLTTAGCTQRPAPAATPTLSASPTPSSPASSTAAVRAPTSKASPPPSSSTRPSPAASRSPAAIPPLSAAARAAGLVDIRTIIPDAIVDLRYATAANFVGVVLYPADARCLVHTSMTSGLITAAARLREQGYTLVFWDCYRPHAVQIHMFEVVSDPNWVARPGPYATSHEAARSVDITLAAADRSCPAAQRIQSHCLLDMGTGFDDFTARAHAFATYGVSARAQSNRAVLRHAMNDGGITVYSGEWWHFDGPGADVERPHLNAPLS
jgi:D-alanyl-D-alanine dipeptidase